MLAKKLLTLACAFGILICGACFAPPYNPPPRPAPPPLHIDLRGIRRIDIIATDESQLKKLDVHKFADRMAIEINVLSRDTRVRVRHQDDPKPADGVLKITVLEEKARLTPVKDVPSVVNWTLEIRVAASLTNRAGQEIWSQSGREYTYSGRMSTQDAAQFWESRAAPGSMPYQLCPRFVHSMFYGDPYDH
jgi:hypothetical protein